MRVVHVKLEWCVYDLHVCCGVLCVSAVWAMLQVPQSPDC